MVIVVVEALFTRISLLAASAAGSEAILGVPVSREGKIEGEGDAPVDAAEILAALARETMESGARRRDAASCYFSASAGWREASTVLGGAFAAEEAELKSGKGE